MGKVYTIAYVDDEGGEVVFNYTKPGSEDLNYYFIFLKIAMSQKIFLRIHGLKFIECLMS